MSLEELEIIVELMEESLIPQEGMLWCRMPEYSGLSDSVRLGEYHPKCAEECAEIDITRRSSARWRAADCFVITT